MKRKYRSKEEWAIIIADIAKARAGGASTEEAIESQGITKGSYYAWKNRQPNNTRVALEAFHLPPSNQAQVIATLRAQVQSMNHLLSMLEGA